MTAAAGQQEYPDMPDFPMARTCPYHPPPEYAELHAKGPLTRVRLWDGRHVWLATGHSVSRSLLADPRISSDRQNPNYPMFAARLEDLRKIRTALAGVDPPEHTAQRRILIPSFTVKRANALRPAIQELTDSLVDSIIEQGPPVDLVDTFALALPSQVACRLLGIPYDDHGFFQETFEKGTRAESTREDVASARATLKGYLHDLIRLKESNPDKDATPGLLNELIDDQLRTGGLSPDEIVSLTGVVLSGGYDTTVNMISLSILTLLEYPDQADALRSDPQLAGPLVEELMRFLSIADGIARVATADIEIGNYTIKAGDGIFIATAAANRDSTVYEDPSRFNIRRAPRQHIGFGFGIHQCIGQNLARAELEIALTTLFTRIPTMQLAVPVDTIPMKGAGTIQGITQCPVTW